jgi:hypothetical protein
VLHLGGPVCIFAFINHVCVCVWAWLGNSHVHTHTHIYTLQLYSVQCCFCEALCAYLTSYMTCELDLVIHTHTFTLYSYFVCSAASGRPSTQTHFHSSDAHMCMVGQNHICRVGQNHIYTVCVRYFWQGNHQIYGQIRCIYTVLANPTYMHAVHDRIFGDSFANNIVYRPFIYGSGQPYTHVHAGLTCWLHKSVFNDQTVSIALHPCGPVYLHVHTQVLALYVHVLVSKCLCCTYL